MPFPRTAFLASCILDITRCEYKIYAAPSSNSKRQVSYILYYQGPATIYLKSLGHTSFLNRAIQNIFCCHPPLLCHHTYPQEQSHMGHHRLNETFRMGLCGTFMFIFFPTCIASFQFIQTSPDAKGKVKYISDSRTLPRTERRMRQVREGL